MRLYVSWYPKFSENLQIITLEMDGARAPVQHAKIMVEQAQIVTQKLELSTVIYRA